MTYAIRHSATGNQMLVEMSAHDARLAFAGQHDQARHGVWFERCNGHSAHTWVRNGSLHSTALWVDQGKIRRAG
jgi:hypothetical protein